MCVNEKISCSRHLDSHSPAAYGELTMELISTAAQVPAHAGADSFQELWAMERKSYRGSFSSRSVDHGGAMLEQTVPEGHGEDPCWNIGKMWRRRRGRKELLGRDSVWAKVCVTWCHISHKELSLPALNSKAQVYAAFKEVQLKAAQKYLEN